MDKKESSPTDIVRKGGEETQLHGENSAIDIVTSGDELRDVFSRVQHNLNVVHINCQSISAHYMQMLSTFNSNAIDAILVSETFLKPTTNSDEFSLPGFALIRNDREDKGGGGVAIYLRKEISSKIVESSPSNYSMSAEHLFIEILYKGTKVLLGVYYSPSLRINYFAQLKNLLEKHRRKYEYFITMGDFNTDLIKNDRRSKKLLNIIDDYDLYVLPLRQTHFAPHKQASKLDLIIVSSICDVEKYGQLAGCFSYHDILYLSYRLKIKDEVPIAPLTTQTGDGEPFWQSTRVREALARQLKAMKKYKISQLTDDFTEYTTCREQVKKLETEFKRERKKCVTI